MPAQSNQPLPDGYQLQNYRISKVLSCGGFSIVYLAHDENATPVAIKEFLPSSLALRREGDALPSIAEENVAIFRYGMKCFFEEGRSLARLSHANVVRVLNFFRANETVYMGFKRIASSVSVCRAAPKSISTGEPSLRM